MFTLGVLATFTFGVPLTATLQGPLWEAATVPCTGSGVFITITGAEPLAAANRLGMNDREADNSPKPNAMNIILPISLHQGCSRIASCLCSFRVC
jgi:hypothetical protein